MKKLIALVFGLLIAVATTASPPDRPQSEPVQKCNMETTLNYHVDVTVATCEVSCMHQIQIADAFVYVHLTAQEIVKANNMDRNSFSAIYLISPLIAENYHDNWPSVVRKFSLPLFSASCSRTRNKPPVLG
jgi:hypothetical protein